MSLDRHVRDTLLKELSQQANAVQEFEVLNNAFRLLAKWKSIYLQQALIRDGGTIVRQGPLKGMDFLSESSEGCHIAKLLGCYEQPLQQFIEEAIQTSYDTILNIGCAEGYYAVGMARKMPNSKVFAFDVNASAQEVCAKLATKNKVQDQVVVDGLFEPTKFDSYCGEKVLVMCDIEGAEDQLLNPQISSGIANMDLIVESHECLKPGITRELITRFEKTHHITLVQDNGQRHLSNMPQWFNNLPNLDQLMAVWEWRSGPTPWLVMKSKSS